MFLRKVVAFFRNICFFSQLKSPFIDAERRLYLPRLHLSYYSFCQSIYSVRIILLVEAGTEESGECLIETGTDRAEECLDKVIGG